MSESAAPVRRLSRGTFARPDTRFRDRMRTAATRCVGSRKRAYASFQGHSELNLPEALNLVVRTRAVDEANPEVREAIRRLVPVVTYGEYGEAVGRESVKQCV